jgi:hypothetical protein
MVTTSTGSRTLPIVAFASGGGSRPVCAQKAVRGEVGKLGKLGNWILP